MLIAVDHDRDGRIDLWNVGPDVVASVGRYLQRTGWRADQTWGREVTLPAGGEETLAAPMADGAEPPAVCRSYESLGAFRNLSGWQALGVRSADGRDLPTRDLPAALVVGDGGDDRGWLVYRNFCSLMRYNPAFRYALSVGLLADAIGSGPGRTAGACPGRTDLRAIVGGMEPAPEPPQPPPANRWTRTQAVYVGALSSAAWTLVGVE